MLVQDEPPRPDLLGGHHQKLVRIRPKMVTPLINKPKHPHPTSHSSNFPTWGTSIEFWQLNSTSLISLGTMPAGGRVRYLKHTALGLLGSREDEMVALWPLADLPTALAGGGEVNQTLCECLLGPLGGRGLILKSSPITAFCWAYSRTTLPWRSFLLLYLFGGTDSCSSPLDTFCCHVLPSFSFGVTAQAYVE